MRRNYTRVGDMDCIFCRGKIGMCVQQPWQSICLWSVADRFLSTFSFILICGSSLSLSHAENEVSRLETALQTHLSNFALLSSYPIYGASSGLKGHPCRLEYAFFRRKTVYPPLFSQITLHAGEKKVLCSFLVCQFSLPTAMSTFMLNMLLLQPAQCSV